MQDCKSKRKLRIAVPKRDGFQVFVNVIDPFSKKKNVTGYNIDIFEAAMRNLHPRPCYKFSIFDGTYDELVGNVSLGVRLSPTTIHPILLQGFHVFNSKFCP